MLLLRGKTTSTLQSQMSVFNADGDVEAAQQYVGEYISAINKFSATYDANPNDVSVLKPALAEFKQARGNYFSKENDMRAKRSREENTAKENNKRTLRRSMRFDGTQPSYKNYDYDPSHLRKFKKEHKQILELTAEIQHLTDRTGVVKKWTAIEELEKKST